LAFRNIVSQPGKTALALSGIGIAIVLMFMQLGFLGAVQDTATNVYDKLSFDLLLRSPDYLHLADAGRLTRQPLDEVAGMSGVAAVNRLRIAMSKWRDPQGRDRGVLLLGVRPRHSPFCDSQVDQDLERLESRATVLIDRKSQAEFGPADGQRFGLADLGRTVVVGETPVVVAGLFTMGAGLTSNGAALVSEETFGRLVPYFAEHDYSFGLVRLEPGIDWRPVLERIEARFRLPDGSVSVEVLPRGEVRNRELHRWISETPIGFIFSLGVAIAAMVGAVIVYMILANDVSSRIPEYATLRAMGYSSQYLASVVMKQAWYLALMAFVPSVLMAWALYWATGAWAGVALTMTWPRVLGVFAATVSLCAAAGVVALQKLWKVQPAELF
jgi:putative ABC transport system permease protein